MANNNDFASLENATAVVFLKDMEIMEDICHQRDLHQKSSYKHSLTFTFPTVFRISPPPYICLLIPSLPISQR